MSHGLDPLLQSAQAARQEQKRRRIIFAIVMLVALGLAVVTVRQDPRPVLSQTSYEQPVEIIITATPNGATATEAPSSP